MARNEQDREDLIREAVALTRRVELRVSGFDQLITAGFRPDSAMSLFIGQDPVYQFDAEGRLRRGFVSGFLYRSQHSTLTRLERVRTETQTVLQRADLCVDELHSFRDGMHDLLTKLSLKLRHGEFEILRSVPDDADHIVAIQSALEAARHADDWLSTAIRRRI